MDMIFDRIRSLYQAGSLTEDGVLNAITTGRITVEQATEIIGGDDEGLSVAKSAKLKEISKACNATIVAGVDVETTNGTDHFNLATEDQANISNLFNLVVLGGTEFPYQSDGGVCATYTATDIATIYVTAQSLITSQTTYHNLLKQYVESLESAEDVLAVVYGQDLTDDYAAQYAEKLAIASEQMTAIMAKLTATE